MADTISPISSPTPPQIPGNVSTLVSPDILANLKTSEKPKAFGDQLLKVGLAAGANAALNSTILKLYKEKADLIREETQLNVNHRSELLKINNQYNIDKKQAGNDEQKLSESEKKYKASIANEEKNYKEAQINLQERKDKNQKDIDNYLKDPFTKQKEKIKKRKEARTKLKNRTKKEKQDSRKQKRKAVLKNVKKTIVPILTLLLTDKIAEIISQNDIIKELVDKTNAIIEDANASNDPTKLENAKIVRDNAIRVIQSNEDKIIKINDQIQKITIYITIFSTIIAILTAIPIPTAVPPGVGIPVNVITKIVVILEKANKIVLALSALLSIITVSLEKAIQILEELKAQLLPINGELELKLPPTPVAFGTADYGEYKGFKFALREENNPKFKVRGNKRHFAVAINKQNIEQLKSEPSFTLDPNDLIEQLKLVIDQQNLQG